MLCNEPATLCRATPWKADGSTGAAPGYRRVATVGAMKPTAPADVEEIRLRDGSRIWVRPIRHEDRDRMVQGLSWLSDRSRYMRFHSHIQRLSASQLDYLIDVDHDDHEALIALDPDRPDVPGVGVARYIRTSDEPSVAEAAITVIDDYQGRGIGTALIGILEGVAYERGIRTFRNYVLAQNQAMLAIFRQLDGQMTNEGGGLYCVDIPIPAPGDAQPDTPAGRWLTSVGRQQQTRRGTWAYPVIWLLRKVTGLDLDDQLGESRLLKNWAGGIFGGDEDDKS